VGVSASQKRKRIIKLEQAIQRLTDTCKSDQTRAAREAKKKKRSQEKRLATLRANLAPAPLLESDPSSGCFSVLLP